ncbi:MAG TPA: hypothetical protein VL860_14690, partial [Planctomycetota bacterium]|nr:hypothetical protein [Planctomycetota bacterium]
MPPPAPPQVQLLFRTGALGDALLTVPLIARILNQNPTHSVIWYQSPWTRGLLWHGILPQPIFSQVRIWDSEAADALWWNTLTPETSTPKPATPLNIDQVAGITDVGLRPNQGLAAWCESRNVMYQWIAAPTAAVQTLPHAAERLAGAPVNLRGDWLRNAIAENSRHARLAILHPGAGSRSKLMPLEKWVELAIRLRKARLK